MTDVFDSQSGRGDPPDGHDAAALGQRTGKVNARGHLRGRRSTVRGLGAGMGRDDVPEQHPIHQAEFGQHAVDDRRRGLGRPAARELALRGEGDPRDPGAAVARGLADEQERSLRA